MHTRARKSKFKACLQTHILIFIHKFVLILPIHFMRWLLEKIKNEFDVLRRTPEWLQGNLHHIDITVNKLDPDLTRMSGITNFWLENTNPFYSTDSIGLRILISTFYSYLIVSLTENLRNE